LNQSCTIIRKAAYHDFKQFFATVGSKVPKVVLHLAFERVTGSSLPKNVGSRKEAVERVREALENESVDILVDLRMFNSRPDDPLLVPFWEAAIKVVEGYKQVRAVDH
jgi:hypothetical protein